MYYPGPSTYRKASGVKYSAPKRFNPYSSSRSPPSASKSTVVPDVAPTQLDSALDTLHSSLAQIQEQNRQKMLTIEDIERKTKGASRSDGRLTYSCSLFCTYAFLALVINGEAVVGRKPEGPLGPGQYNEGASVEFVRNTHTFNITNNMLFGEMQRIQQKPIEDEKKAALSLYKSPAFNSVLNQYSESKAGSVKLEKEKRKALSIRAYQARKKKAKQHASGQKQYLTEPATATKEDELEGQMEPQTAVIAMKANE